MTRAGHDSAFIVGAAVGFGLQTVVEVDGLAAFTVVVLTAGIGFALREVER